MKIYLSISVFLFFSTILNGQSFIFNQFFQPSIRVNSFYSHDFNFSDKDIMQLGQVDVNCIIPIKSQLKLKVKWKKILRLKFKNSTKVKVYQIFWNFRPKFMYLDLTYKDANQTSPFQAQPQFSYGFSTGVTGIHLLLKRKKKPRLLFYSVNIGVMEDYKSIQKGPIPSVNALIGLAFIKGFKFYWYWGFYFSYDNDQTVVPAPFLGIQARLSKKIWLNITLPVQIRFSFIVSKKIKIDVGGAVSGFSTAFGYQQNANSEIHRHVFGGFRVRTGTTVNIKLSPQARLYLELGCHPYQLPSFRWNNPQFLSPQVSPSIYGGVSFFYSFKKSLLGSTIDGIITF